MWEVWNLYLLDRFFISVAEERPAASGQLRFNIVLNALQVAVEEHSQFDGALRLAVQVLPLLICGPYKRMSGKTALSKKSSHI